jgi:hypothetical protein
MSTELYEDRTNTASMVSQEAAPKGQAEAQEPGPVPWGGYIYSTENMRTEGPPSLHIRIANTTQGPFWPPSAHCDKDGNFILVGTVITEVAPGKIVPIPRQAVLVSKDTVPPLDKNGKEDFTDYFKAPYKVIRKLDLSPGSPDLDLVLHTISWGPPEGDWGDGAPRMPRLGESRYNLNSFHLKNRVSTEIFPSEAQRKRYTRPSLPLHKAIIPGFQGDQVSYDVETGEPYTPILRNGPDCYPDGCPGEDIVNFRREEPITLAMWMKAEVWLTITLTNFKKGPGPVGIYTAARFDLQARNLLPDSMYSLVMIRSSEFHPVPLRKFPDTSVLPNVLLTDWRGTGRLSRVIPNPFPDPNNDPSGLRIIGVGLGYKSDYSMFGGYPCRMNPGVDMHVVTQSFGDGTLDFTPFITEAP